MDDVVDVKIGHEFTPDEWFAARDDLATIFNGVAEMIRSKGGERAERDADRFIEESRMALIALDYVGNFASGECRFLEIRDRE